MKQNHFLLILWFVAIILSSDSLFSQIPQTMNYQGKITDSSGIAIEGEQTFTINIFNIDTGGSPLWSETKTVTITKGLFEIVLGEEHPLDLDFSEPYWLEISITTGESTETLEPREKLAPVSYAYRAIYSDTAAYSESSEDRLQEKDFRLGRDGQHSMMRRLVSDCSELPTSGDFSWIEVSDHYFNLPYNFCISTPIGLSGWYSAMDICTDMGGRICSNPEYRAFNHQTSVSVDDLWTNDFDSDTDTGGICRAGKCDDYLCTGVDYDRCNGSRFCRCCVIVSD